MTIAELFVNLGVKGDGEAQKALKGVQGTLGGISTAGLAAKAGILAVLYGVEQLMSSSMQLGTTMLSYATYTGMSAEELQRWQYQASLANVSAEEMQNSFVHLKKAMFDMSRGGSAPAGFGMLGDAVAVDPERVSDTLYMMKKVRDAIQLIKNEGQGNWMAESFGWTPGMISAARRGMLSDENLSKAPILREGQLKSLDKVKQGFTEVGKMFEIMVAELSSKHGGMWVKNLKLISVEFINLIKQIDMLIAKTNALHGISMVFEGWGKIFEGISSVIQYIREDQESNATLKKSKGGEDDEGDALDVAFDYWKGKFFDKAADMVGTQMLEHNQKKFQASQTKSGNTTNMTVNVHGVKDAHNVPHEIKKHFDRAGRQMSSQKRAN